MNYKLIYTAAPKKEAEKLAEILVKERLAACVDLLPSKSVYWWQGRIEKAKEVVLLIKTKETLADIILKRIKELHSYKIPCILCLNIEKGNLDCFNWIDEETKKT